jgi:mannose-6-phosphate isomerase-like protein (cupin superfamily)
MLRNGDVIELPGTRFVVTLAPANPAVDSLEMEITLEAGALGPPPHYHPTLEEEYRVLRGSLNVLIGDRWKDFGSGESVVIPARSNHTFRNTSQEPVLMLNVHRPAQGFAAFMERAKELSQAGKLKSMKDPRMVVRVSTAFMEDPGTTVPTGFLGRVVMPVAAWFGRRLGVNRIASETVVGAGQESRQSGPGA